jgi:hypothetical protein
MADSIPDFCDYDCPHAAFPPAETAGICRTMSGVWCRKLSELTRKNAACEWRRRQGAKRTRGPAKRRGKK